MGRVNKTIEGVFVDIVGDAEKVSTYDVFINLETKKSNKELKGFVNEYKKVIDANKANFEKLAHLEEIIMQIRSRENIDDIKLSVVRDYIYARCPFYRKEKSSKDIRIIVDHLDLWKDRMSEIENSPELMERAKIKLTKVMDQEIEENIHNYRAKYKTLPK